MPLGVASLSPSSSAASQEAAVVGQMPAMETKLSLPLLVSLSLTLRTSVKLRS